ncbi:Fanconi anemia core complex-associated protein 24 isoform 2-T2 [Thomomys bottae]
MDSDPPDDTGPVHVPLGYVVARERWRGSQLAQEMQGKIKLIFEDGLNLADFYLSSRSCIIFITEAELVAGNGYRKRLVRVRNCGHLQGIVVVEKTQINEQYFPAIQKFVVLDLGMVLLPVGNQMEAACLIVQFVEEQSQETRKNPFLRKTTRKFPSIQQLSNASVKELEPVVGPVVAQQIYAFFTQSS